MKKITLLVFVFSFVFIGQLEAQNCNQGNKLARNTWNAWGNWTPNISLIPFKNKVRKIKNTWNVIAAQGTATIGPRLLELDGGFESGSVAGQTKRTFVSHPSFDNRVEITINKTEGRARTGIVICVQGRDGVSQQKVSYEFPSNRNGKVKKFVLNGVKGKIIMVAMRNKSVGNKFKYRIKGIKK